MFKFVFATIAVLIAGCAAHSGPIIDTKGVDLLAYEQDLAECQTISRQIRTEIGVAKGTAAGAAVGGATGAISGNAARGAGYGAIYGATQSALTGERDKSQVVKRCVQGRGYRVLN